MPNILIHNSVTEILIYLDPSIAEQVLETALLFQRDCLGRSLPATDIEEHAIQSQFTLFRGQSLFVFMTKNVDGATMIMSAWTASSNEFELTENIVDCSQNNLQDLHDGINSSLFKR